MGAKASKPEPQENLREVPSLCLRMQGLNESNQCGRNYFPFNSQKVVVSVVGGMDHSLGILNNGQFVAWGSNRFGQLGCEEDSYIQSYLYERSMIRPVSFPKHFMRLVIVSVSAGAWHSACVTDSYQVFTWGLGTDGQLGFNPKDYSMSLDSSTKEKYLNKPKLVSKLQTKKAVSVHCGGNFTIVKTEDLEVLSFGYGKDGALGTNTLESTYNPQVVTSLAGLKIKKVACGFNHVLALTAQGEVYSWGNLFKDILENPQVQPEPALVPSINKVSDIACGDYHCCAIEQDSTQLFAWGSNGYGQLGSNIYSLDYITATPVGTYLNNVSQVVCGGLFTVAKLKNNSVYAWGCNRQKQIGEEFANLIREPTLIIKKNKDLKKIVAGYSHMFMLSREVIGEEIIVNPKREILRKTEHRSEDFSGWRDATSDKDRDRA